MTAVEVEDDMTVNVDAVNDDVTCSVVEVGLIVCICRFNVIVPGPMKVTMVGLFEPEQISPPKQFQLENL